MLFAETIARHFDGASVDGTSVRLGFDDAVLRCRVNGFQQVGAKTSASLFMHLTSGHLGLVPIFVSISGYGASRQEAVVAGACLWACELSPVLRAGLTGTAEEQVEQLEATVDGAPYRVFVAGLDRAMTSTDDDAARRIPAARARLGGRPLLTPVVLQADVLPVLPPTSTLLSVFVGDGPEQRTVEVKVNGSDWVPSARAFPQPLEEPPGGMTLLRELAVLVPTGAPAVPSRAAVDRTLAGLALRNQPWQVAGWRGWRSHAGLLAPPLSSAGLAEVERSTGRLTDDHRDFLTQVAPSGAGPGYGLLPPQRNGDTVPLAYAGCGVTWALRLDEGHRGEVWVDASSSDGSVAPVASSFLGWYLSWLDAAVRDSGPWTQWDSLHCATASVLAQLLEDEGGERPVDLSGRLLPGSITLSDGDDGTRLDPCHGCVELAARYGLRDDVFA